MKQLFALVISAALLAPAVRADERDAVAISNNIQQRHSINGVIIDPVFATPDGSEIIAYSRGGDAALWTGHYLAAESFRYAVTKSPDALANVKRALAGIRLLIDVTGNKLLARCAFPANWKYAQSVIAEERGHGVYTRVLNGETYVWIGETSRDQYSGVFFGLGVASGFVYDAEVQATIKDLGTRLLDYLTNHHWFVTMPDGSISTTFAARPEQRLSFLAVGRSVNNQIFASEYNVHRILYSHFTSAGIALDVLNDHDSYFKFNLDTINLFHLIRTEGNSTYRGRYLDAYTLLRRTTDDHGNAHFNMIDRALRGPDARRDEATRLMLNDWLKRPRRDTWLDWRKTGRFALCGADKACAPLPTVDRITTDFLWQRSPFLLWGGGYGKTEGAGIDYILPYWMARYYAVIQEYQTPSRATLPEQTGLPVRPGV